MNIYLYEPCILDDKFSDTIKQNENVVKNVCKKIYIWEKRDVVILLLCETGT